MDKTNYTVLSIVAIVALTAIVSMFLQARAAEGLTPIGEAVSVTANAIVELPRSGGITRNVVYGSGSSSPSRPEGNVYDLNNNGRIDAGDSEILGLVVDRVAFCPRAKSCDLDGNGVITVEDLALLNRQLLERELTAPSGTSTSTVTVDERVLSIATTGGVS